MMLMMLVSGTGAQAPTTIVFNGDTITVEGSGAVVTGKTVLITAAGTYNLSGTLNDGQVLVDVETDGLVTLVLNGVDMTSSTSAPIYIKEADEVTLVLAEGTENFVTDAATYVYASPDDDEPNAAVFSDDPLTIEGQGSLRVIGNYNDGITGKDSLMIRDAPVITVTAADDGIRGKDYLLVSGGKLTVTAQGDGLKSDNDDGANLGYIMIEGGEISINAGDDAIQAETTFTLNAGDLNLISGGSSRAVIDESRSAKGIKAKTLLTVNGGTIVIDAADDGLHSDQDLTINAGTITISSGDDAIRASYNLTINAGTIDILTSYEGIESGYITINGGDIRLISSDDGINVSDPEAVSTGGRPGGGRGPRGNFNSPYYLHINGGTIVVDAEGDGLDSNGSIAMTNGTVIVNGPTRNGNGALDYDGGFNMTGGLIIAAGSAGMPQTPDETSTINSVLINFDAPLAAGTLVYIQTSDGEPVLTFAPTKTFQSIAFSSPELVTGGTYEVYTGGSASGTATDGVYQDKPASPGDLYTSFTISSTVTWLGQVRRGWW